MNEGVAYIFGGGWAERRAGRNGHPAWPGPPLSVPWSTKRSLSVPLSRATLSIRVSATRVSPRSL